MPDSWQKVREANEGHSTGGSAQEGADATAGRENHAGDAPGGEPNANVAAIRRALLEDALSLRDALRGERPALDPVPGTGGMLARGEGHVVFSERGEGKSLLAVILGLSAAARGERVLYLDRENGDTVTADRVRPVFEAHPEWAHVVESGAFVGSHWPTVSAGWRGEDVAAALDGFTLLFADSTREFINQLGGENNSDDSVSALFSLLVTPLRARGGTAVLLDNTGHENTHRPKGAGGKLDAAPTAHRVVTLAEFGPDQRGEIEVTCTRSRHGMIGRTWRLAVGGGIYEVPHAPTEEEQTNARLLRSEVLNAALVVLAKQSPLGREPLIKAIRDRKVTGRSDTLREVLADLASDPASGIVRDPGSGYRRGVTP